MSDYVVDGLGMIHSRANWDALRPRLSPSWLRVLEPVKPVSVADMRGFHLVSDSSMDPNSFEIRVGTQRLLVRGVRWLDTAIEIMRWEDDGGAAP